MLPKKTLVIEPLRGWHGTQTNQSVKALQRLAWQEHRLRIETPSTSELQSDRILRKGNEGEVTLRTPTASYQVDGYDRLTNTVYQFHGCLFHGCPRCSSKRSQKGPVHYGRTMEEVYEATRGKEDKLRQSGYTVPVQWDCDCEMWLKRDPTLKQFVKELELIDPWIRERHSLGEGPMRCNFTRE